MTHSDSGEHRIPTQVVNMAGGGHGTGEERMLVERAKSGNQEAFEKLVHLCDRGVLRLAYRILGNAEDAQDAYQETFLKAFRYLRNFRFESSLNTWTYQIATNVCLDRLRQRQKRRESTMDDSRTDPADAFAVRRQGWSWRPCGLRRHRSPIVPRAAGASETDQSPGPASAFPVYVGCTLKCGRARRRCRSPGTDPACSPTRGLMSSSP